MKIPIEADSDVKSRVKQVASFKGKVHQVDEYFTPVHRDFLSVRFPFEWLSIRKRGNKSILNYKHFHPEGAEVHTHCDEVEVEVTSPDRLKRIFTSLDMRSLVIVEKDREIYSTDEFEIALDDVRGLGSFIEIEAVKGFSSVEAARRRLLRFAESLGLDIDKEDKRGYPYLLLEKQDKHVD